MRNPLSINPTAPVSLILDTDMGNDIDDALALAMIHALQTRGECRLLGVTVSKDNPLAPAFVDVVNTFYGRGTDVAIGTVRDGKTPDERTFLRPIVTAMHNGRPRYARTRAIGDYPDAVRTLRKLLAAEADRSVVIVMIGFSTNVARLLDSPADEFSPLNGTELVARKVNHVVAMAGDFSPEVQAQLTLENREYNVHQDIESGARFFHGCPVPVIFSGYEVGLALPFPASSILEDYNWAEHHPVAEAYRHYKPMPYDRPSWDLTAVLQAVRPDGGYFELSEPGRVTICNEGTAHFAKQPGGHHRFLVLPERQRPRLLEDMVRLCAEPPTHCRRRCAHVAPSTCAGACDDTTRNRSTAFTVNEGITK
jgi:inosine-uridine nucleoside N-ribohydrolase